MCNYLVLIDRLDGTRGGGGGARGRSGAETEPELLHDHATRQQEEAELQQPEVGE